MRLIDQTPLQLACGLVLLQCVVGAKVLLFSIDGFRHDYFNSTLTPNLWNFARAGVRAKYMLPVVVTKTFPNHWTIVTGVYVEKHGIISNSLYDPQNPNITNIWDPHWWQDAEPIWNQVMKAGRRTGAFFWPGSEVLVQNLRPTFMRRYDESTPFDHRIETVLEWFQYMDVQFATMYIKEPDATAHRFGPDSAEVMRMMKTVDGYFGQMIARFNSTGLLKELNVIIVGDHGLAGARENSSFYLYNHVDRSLIAKTVDRGPMMQIWPKSPNDDIVLVEKINSALQVTNVFCTAYLKKNIPDKYHYKNHRRVPPVFVLCNEGYSIQHDSSQTPQPGDHGFSNTYESMRTNFIAAGPNMKSSTVETLKNVDIYPFMCKLLNIEPHKHDGDETVLLPFVDMKRSDAASLKTSLSACLSLSVALLYFVALV